MHVLLWPVLWPSPLAHTPTHPWLLLSWPVLLQMPTPSPPCPASVASPGSPHVASVSYCYLADRVADRVGQGLLLLLGLSGLSVSFKSPILQHMGGLAVPPPPLLGTKPSSRLSLLGPILPDVQNFHLE